MSLCSRRCGGHEKPVGERPYTDLAAGPRAGQLPWFAHNDLPNHSAFYIRLLKDKQSASSAGND